MGKNLTILATLAAASLSACAGRPVQQSVAPALPAAALNQVTILDPEATVVGHEAQAQADPRKKPAVIDMQAALKATPEVRELRLRRYRDDAPEYYVLIHRANERVREAIRRIATRRSLGMILEAGTVVLKPDISDVAVTDITEEVAYLVGK